MQISLHDIIGTIGVALIIGTYLFLQLRKIKSDSLLFSLLNLIGSLMIMVSLIFSFNLSAFLIEFFWALISLFGIYNFFKFNAKKSRRKEY